MDNHIPQINGDLLRIRREELGWALADLATRACLSKKQVKQIEEGGTSSFYSDTVKITAAKKIGGILGLPEEAVFVVEEQEAVVAHAHEAPSQETVLETELKQANDEVHAVPSEPKSPADQTELVSPASQANPKTKNSLWLIIALFVAALGLAAVMQQPSTTPPAEPPPPIQVIPSEQAEPAASAPNAAAPVAPVVVPANMASAASPVAIPVVTPVATTPLPAIPATSSAPASQAAPAAPFSSKPQ